MENNKAEEGARKRVIREFLQRNGHLNQDLRKWRRKPWEQVKGSVSLGRGNSLHLGGSWKQAWLVWAQQGGQRGWKGVSEAQKTTVERQTDGGRGGWKLLSNCRQYMLSEMWSQWKFEQRMWCDLTYLSSDDHRWPHREQTERGQEWKQGE